MGKETKIGLAVIGALLSFFVVLLFRHLNVGNTLPQWDHEERASAEPLTPADPGDQPSVVTAQKDEPPGDALWAKTPIEAAPEQSGEVPNESYLPADSAPANNAPANAQGGGPVVRATPFANRGPEDVPSADETAAESPPAKTPVAGRPNPLRRLSAELPLDSAESEPSEEGGVELPQQPADPYSTEETPAEPVATDPEPAREPAPVVERSAPAMIAPSQNDEPQTRQNDPFDPPSAQPKRVASGGEPRRDAASGDGPSGDAAAPQDRAAAPLPVENGMYTVQPNDTLWSISEKVYGTGGYFKAIAAHNRSSLPRSDQLTVGTKVAVPPASELEANFPALCPKQRKSVLVRPRATQATATAPIAGGDVYLVEEGDTLFDIARYELGKASRWAEIYELNRETLGEDFDYLRPGIELKMPPKARGAETISRGGDDRYVR